jgi:hypothetical protein
MKCHAFLKLLLKFAEFDNFFPGEIMNETLTPAYGRDYKSSKAVLADWNSGKDFKMASTGQYVNNEDGKGKNFNIRYSNLSKIVVVKG